MGGWLRLPFLHNGTGCVSEKLSHDRQTTLQGKAGNLVTVIVN